MKKHLLKTILLLFALILGTGVSWADETYSLTPDQASTGSNATAYITTLTEFTHNGVSWKMNQWNPKTLQIRTNQASAANEFRFYNTSAIPGRIKQVVITFDPLSVSDASKLMFKGGISEVSSTSGGTAGTWNSSAKTLTWTPGNSDDFTYFAFYQNGKAASGSNYLAETNAIVVTYETESAATLESIALSGDYPTAFHQGDTFSHEGMTVTATYDDDSKEDVTANAIFSGYDMSTTGDHTVTVSYTENEVTKTAEYGITVSAPATLSSISLSGDYQTVFTEGDEFNHEGLVVTANYDDDTHPIVTGDAEFSTPNMNEVGKQTITVTYGGKNTTYDITVNPLPKYTVTFSDGGSETQASYGASVTLPSRSAISGYTFAGWSETNVDEETTTAPTIIPAGSYTPTTNITLYPVYTKTEGGGGSQNETASVTISAYATANKWSNGNAYQPLNMDANISVGGEVSGNNFKYYTSDSSWRFYTGGSFTITANNGATLSSVTLTISSGTLKYGETTLKSGTAFNVTGNSAIISCTANAKITAISVDYTIAGAGTTYYWSAPVAAAVEKPTITVAENPFLFSTTATITCSTDDAAIKYSYDGETWNDYSSDLTITATTTIYAKAVKDDNESTVASVTATKNLATPTVTISGDLIVDLNGETDVEAGTLTAAVTYNEAAVDGAVVTWSSSNADVATIGESTGVVTIKTRGTVTFTATYASNGDYAEATDTKQITVTDSKAPGTENNPYTVAQAIAATPASGTSANVYIRGIVSAFYGSDITDDYSHRYYISDDGTTTGQLLVYNGKGLNNVAFSAAEDLQLGDVVVILGGLTTYKGDAEVAANNYIVSLKRKTVPGLAWSTDAFEAVNGEENVYPTLTNTNSVAVTYSSSNESVATIADNGIITLVANGETTITASFAGNSDYLEQEVSYTLTVSGFSKDAAGIAFAESEVNITFGDEFAGQALTNPNSLTVTYSSNDEDVALVDENTGEVIIGNAGSATITATFIENEDYLGAVVTYTINVAKAAAGLSFDETSFKVAPDAEFEAPTLNNPNSLTVTYSSSDEDVALVDENTGEVLILDEGTATITAAFAGNDNYLAGNATYTINITSILDITWDLSTDNTTTASGTEMSWVASPAAMRVDKANSGTATNNYYPGTAGKTYTSTRFYNGSKLTISPAFGYQITSVEFTATSDGYATALKNSAWTNATAVASEKTVTVTPTNGLKAMTATIGGTCGFSSVIVYYKEATSAYITLAEACTDGEGMYYGTFSSPKAFVVPEDIVVSEIAIVDNKLFVVEYATGAIVPANTGVMVSSTTFGDHSVAFSTGGTSVLGEDNRLRASGAGITAEAMAAADSECLFYRLTMHNGTDIGFWWGAAEGAAFSLAANKAYLAVSNAVSVKGFSLFSDDETGITEVAEKTEAADKVFDLSGRRVVKPTKGLYIVNGKKYIKK